MNIMNSKSLLREYWWAHRSSRCKFPEKKYTRKDAGSELNKAGFDTITSTNYQKFERAQIWYSKPWRKKEEKQQGTTTTTTSMTKACQQLLATNYEPEKHHPQTKSHTSNLLHNVSDKLWNKVQVVSSGRNFVAFTMTICTLWIIFTLTVSSHLSPQECTIES